MYTHTYIYAYVAGTLVWDNYSGRDGGSIRL